MSIYDNVFGFFVEEAGEHLRVLEGGLLQLEKDPSAAAELIESLFRAAHTLKGSANLMTITDVGAVAHRIEDLLEDLRTGVGTLRPAQVDAMLFALDQMRELIEFRKQGEVAPERLVTETLRRLAEAETPSAEAEAGDADVVATAEADEPETATALMRNSAEEAARERRSPGRRLEEAGVVRVGMEKIESLMGLVGEFTVTKNHLLSRLPVMEQMRSEVDFAGKRLLKEVSGFAERYDYSLPVQSALSGDESFNELEFDRYDELNLFSRKLREITNDIDAALKEMAGFYKGFSRDVQTLDRMTDEMKEQISAARTVPAGQLFQRFSRMVRDMSQDLGKPVEFLIAGGETPIDRVIYDGLYDPLLHIVRNAFAHGIEPINERLAADKPATAKILLKAERRGNTVEITVQDDGRGIDLQRVRARGIEKGFFAASDPTSDQELIQLIFRPGFSTTLAADSQSGRGVGMNVVMDRLAGLNGTIDVDTESGQGTSFRLRLPLSLVIVNIIQFSCAGQQLVIPSALVEEIVDLEYAQRTSAVYESHKSLQRIDLAELLKLTATQSTPAYGIVTQSEGTPVMLLVDAILGQEDTVIKPFGAFLQELPYISGSSLAGDGTMRLVINPARMKRHKSVAVTEAAVAASLPSANTPVAKVLLVDDSLSVRKFASLLLSGRGYEVVTAINGDDALAKLQTEAIFSIITDLEMPGMHGYELLRELKNSDYRHIPVAVLTSRAGEQHRREAFALGATDYLVKPFDEDGLLAVVNRHRQL